MTAVCTWSVKHKSQLLLLCFSEQDNADICADKQDRVDVTTSLLMTVYLERAVTEKWISCTGGGSTSHFLGLSHLQIQPVVCWPGWQYFQRHQLIRHCGYLAMLAYRRMHCFRMVLCFMGVHSAVLQDCTAMTAVYVGSVKCLSATSGSTTRRNIHLWWRLYNCRTPTATKTDLSIKLVLGNSFSLYKSWYITNLYTFASCAVNMWEINNVNTTISAIFHIHFMLHIIRQASWINFYYINKLASLSNFAMYCCINTFLSRTRFYVYLT